MRQRLTYDLAMAAAADTATQRMRREGRTKWNGEDWQAMVETFERLYPSPESSNR